MSDWKQFEYNLVVDYGGGGTRYVLPRRRLGRIRHLGWAVAGGGTVATVFMVFWMSGPILAGVKLLGEGQAAGWFSIGFGCLGLFGLVPAAGLLIAGFAILFNQTSCVVELRNGVLRTSERFLVARWRRKRSADKIQRLRVKMADEWKTDQPQQDLTPWLGDSGGALVAEGDDGRDFLVAVAYPRELLRQLATDLAARIEAELMTTASTIERDPVRVAAESASVTKVDVVEGSEDRADGPLVPPQPADGVATIERRPHGVTINIPPVGVWKGSRGLIFFSLIWNGLLSVFVTVAILGMAGVLEVEADGPLWLMPVFLIPFVAVGVGTMLAAINMGRRHATIATADELVMLVRHSIFGKKTHEWSAEQIEEIKVGPSGIEVNDVPISELQIHVRHAQKLGCLSQLDDAELAWIAAELNQALSIGTPHTNDGVAAEYRERDELGRVVAQPASRISVEYSTEGTVIDVPPRGFTSYISGLLIGLLLMAIAAGVAIGVGGKEFKNGFDVEDLFTLGFIGLWSLLFGGAGAAVFFGCLIATRRRFKVTADSHQLTVVRGGLLGTKTFHWMRDALRSVEVTDSGTKVNNRTHYQVSIRPHEGDPVGIMTGHDRSDLACVATAINDTLGLTNAGNAHRKPAGAPH